MTRPIDELAFEHLLFSRYTSSLSRRAQDNPLERSAYILLSRLAAQGPMSVGELSEAFRLDVSTVHRQTVAVMKAGLIERIPDPNGGMARKYRITDHGSDLLETQRALTREGLARVIEDWPDDDVADFVSYLHRFNVAVETRQDSPWPRQGTTH